MKIIELCGLPMTGKTTTLEQLKQLIYIDDIARIHNHFIPDHVSLLKTTTPKTQPHFNYETITLVNDQINTIVDYQNESTIRHNLFIDRGYHDYLTWLHVLARNEAKEYQARLIHSRTSLMSEWHRLHPGPVDFYTVFFDGNIEGIAAEHVRLHGKLGSIVNRDVMTRYRKYYFELLQQLPTDPRQHYICIHRDEYKNQPKRLAQYILDWVKIKIPSYR